MFLHIPRKLYPLQLRFVLQNSHPQNNYICHIIFTHVENLPHVHVWRSYSKVCNAPQHTPVFCILCLAIINPEIYHCKRQYIYIEREREREGEREGGFLRHQKLNKPNTSFTKEDKKGGKCAKIFSFYITHVRSSVTLLPR